MKTFSEFLTLILTGCAVSLLVAFPVMWLWNYVMPDIFGLIDIDYWQALVLSLLSNFLIKSNGSTSSN